MNYLKLKIGDKIIIEKEERKNVQRYYAIYLGVLNGKHCVAENGLNRKVQYLSLGDFLYEGRLRKIEHSHLNEEQQKKIRLKIAENIGTQYSPLYYNSEHFVNDVLAQSKKEERFSFFYFLTDVMQWNFKARFLTVEF